MLLARGVHVRRSCGSGGHGATRGAGGGGRLL